MSIDANDGAIFFDKPLRCDLATGAHPDELFQTVDARTDKLVIVQVPSLRDFLKFRDSHFLPIVCFQRIADGLDSAVTAALVDGGIFETYAVKDTETVCNCLSPFSSRSARSI